MKPDEVREVIVELEFSSSRRIVIRYGDIEWDFVPDQQKPGQVYLVAERNLSGGRNTNLLPLQRKQAYAIATERFFGGKNFSPRGKQTKRSGR